VEVEVALQREADERCNGVLEFFGEFCGVIRRASCAAAESASMQQAMTVKACANFKASNSATSRV